MEFVQFHPTGHGLAARREGPARDRGGPRRGRDPAQQGRRAVHVEVPARGPPRRVRGRRRGGQALGRGAPRRARRDRRPPAAGAVHPRQRLAGDLHRGPRGPRHRRTAACSWTSATCRPEHVRRKLPSMYDQFKELADVDITKGPMEVGPTTHYVMGGIRVDAETGDQHRARPVRRRRGGGRHARREPPRRQLAVRPARVRGADRRRRGGPRGRPGRGQPYVDPVQVREAAARARGAARAGRGRGPLRDPARPPGR